MRELNDERGAILDRYPTGFDTEKFQRALDIRAVASELEGDLKVAADNILNNVPLPPWPKEKRDRVMARLRKVFDGMGLSNE